MSTKDFFSEPVPEEQDFSGDESFEDMQSLDLFEDSTDADPEQGFAALSDVEDEETGDFSAGADLGLFDEPQTDKGDFGAAVFRSIVSEDSAQEQGFQPAQKARPAAKKQEYKPLSWPKAEPLRRRPQPAPAQPAMPAQPAQPVMAAQPVQPVQPAQPVQYEPAQPVFAPQEEPKAEPEALFEDFKDVFETTRQQRPTQPMESPTQVFNMKSDRPAPKREEKADDADDFDFSDVQTFEPLEEDEAADDQAFDEFDDFDLPHEEPQAPVPTKAAETASSAADEEFDDFDGFGDFDDYADEPEPSRDEKLASYADTLQNVFDSDDFGSDYGDAPEEEDDYAPKAKKKNPFAGAMWDDDEGEDGDEDDGDDDYDDYDEDDESDEPVRRPVQRASGNGGRSGGKRGGKSNLPLVIILVVLLVAIAGVALFAIFGGKNGDDSSSSTGISSSQDTSSSSEPEVVVPTVTPIPRDEWYMKLVNKTSLMTKEECDAITTTNVQGIPVDSRIAEALNNMINAATADGVNLKVVSGFRSYDRQNTNYQAGTTDCPAGASEHNLGLSADIMATDETSYNVANFEATEEYAWLKEHAAEYGFILRYPSGKEDITGFAYEPWHYRYVGVDQAARINASGLTLEEYLAQDAPTGDPTAAVQTDSDASSSTAESVAQ